MLSVIILLAIALAIFLGYKTKINTGLFCLAFSFLIGSFGMGLAPSKIISFWPVKVMFVILSVSLFYNFASINGTLEKLSKSFLYKTRKVPGMLPFALFGIAVLLSIMGATYFTVLAFLAPITLLICEEVNMDKLTGAVAINCGALCGGDFPTANLGVIFRGLVDTAYEASELEMALDTFVMELEIFAFSLVFSLVLVAIFRFAFPENRNIGKGVTFTKPEPYTKDQKVTLQLMLVMMVLVIAFPLLELFFPQVAWLKYLASKMDVGLVAICFSIIALLLKLAPQKEVIAKIPWNTIIMISGAGILISVAVEAGTIQSVSDWISGNVPARWIPVAFSFVGAFMSFFSSTTGVVTPALFPLVPELAATTGLTASTLFTSIVVGAQSSAISPFSSGGSLILGAEANAEEGNRLFNRLILIAVPISVLWSALFNFVLSILI